MSTLSENTVLSQSPTDALAEHFVQLVLDDQGEEAESHIVFGNPIYVGDPKYPQHAIKEYPDGRRHVVDIDRKGVETVVKVLA